MDTDEPQISEIIPPNISFHQQIHDNDTQSSDSNAHVENQKSSSSIIITQEQTNDHVEYEDELDSGQKTPTSRSSTSPSSNFIQQQLNKALNVISPQEKLDKIRQHAKLNSSRNKHIQKRILIL